MANALVVCSPYTREEAAYPMPWLREKKFWPTVSRIDDGKRSREQHARHLANSHHPAYGDLNLIVSRQYSCVIVQADISVSSATVHQ